MKSKISTLLIVGLVAVVSVVACLAWRLGNRKEFTQQVFAIDNGTLGDQAMRKSAADSAAKLSIFTTAEPDLIAFRIMPGRHRYIVAAYWVGHNKAADGFEIVFSNGAKTVVPFSKDDSVPDQRTLFYSAMVFSESLPDELKSKTPNLVSTVTLTRNGQICSNTVTITDPQEADVKIWEDKVGKTVNRDFIFWGFQNLP